MRLLKHAIELFSSNGSDLVVDRVAPGVHTTFARTPKISGLRLCCLSAFYAGVEPAARFLVVAVILLFSANQLPAPISEFQQTTSTPKPKREAAPKVKSKPEATPRSKRNPLRFAGVWRGTVAVTASDGTSGSSSYIIQISDDEKTVLCRWAAVGSSFSGPPEQASCTRFGQELSWSLSGSLYTDTFSMRLNVDGTATFLMDGRWNSGNYQGITYSHSGILSREGASLGPPGSQTIASTSQTPAGGLPVAKPVPNEPGFVYNPFDPASNVLFDVRGKPSGTKLIDPKSGQPFLVP